MSRAPIPGQVKTRLCPPLTHREASHLAAAFLIDVWQAASRLCGVTLHLSHTGQRSDFPQELCDAASIVQDGDDLGARIEHTARTALATSGKVLIIGGDLPGLPTSHLAAARGALASNDAVLGPSKDGGFYLIGLSCCPEGLLQVLPWSTQFTYHETRQRLVERGMKVAEAPRFDDVDTIDDLRALRNGIVAGSLLAPASARVLSSLSCV